MLGRLIGTNSVDVRNIVDFSFAIHRKSGRLDDMQTLLLIYFAIAVGVFFVDAIWTSAIKKKFFLLGSLFLSLIWPVAVPLSIAGHLLFRRLLKQEINKNKS